MTPQDRLIGFSLKLLDDIDCAVSAGRIKLRGASLRDLFTDAIGDVLPGTIKRFLEDEAPLSRDKILVKVRQLASANGWHVILSDLGYIFVQLRRREKHLDEDARAPAYVEVYASEDVPIGMGEVHPRLDASMLLECAEAVADWPRIEEMARVLESALNPKHAAVEPTALVFSASLERLVLAGLAEAKRREMSRPIDWKDDEERRAFREGWDKCTAALTRLLDGPIDAEASRAKGEGT